MMASAVAGAPSSPGFFFSSVWSFSVGMRTSSPAGRRVTSSQGRTGRINHRVVVLADDFWRIECYEDPMAEPADDRPLSEEELREEEERRRKGLPALDQQIAEKYDPGRLSRVVVANAGRGER